MRWVLWKSSGSGRIVIDGMSVFEFRRRLLRSLVDGATGKSNFFVCQAALWLSTAPSIFYSSDKERRLWQSIKECLFSFDSLSRGWASKLQQS